MNRRGPQLIRATASLAVLALLLTLPGCTSTHRAAPVIERAPPATRPAAVPVPKPSTTAREADPRPEYYTVKKGDTLYLIALDYGLDYKELAEWNNLDNPNVIRIGQQLRLQPPVATAVTTPLKAAPKVDARPVTAEARSPAVDSDTVKSQPTAVKVPYSDQVYALMSGSQPKPAPPLAGRAEPRAEEKPAGGAEGEEKIDWSWPAGGKLLSSFNESTNLKGIGIAGKSGQAVIASAAGKVLYSGDGIRGYGKLVIIKHSKEFLSVYAHNSQLLVKEGQSVVKGQKIAEMGSSDAAEVKLHFEIRRFGKPVDPVRLLPAERPA